MANSVEPDQTPRSAASDLGLHLDVVLVVVVVVVYGWGGGWLIVILQNVNRDIIYSYICPVFFFPGQNIGVLRSTRKTR